MIGIPMIGGKGIFILLSLSLFGLGLLGYSQKPPFSKKLNSVERVSSLFTTSVRKLPLIEPNCLRQEDFILPQYKQPEAVALYQQALHFEKNGRGISLEEQESNLNKM
ncbi:hypothetical protein AwWohl_14470 [Gammaproteobacteria bacterium]|nr:hypothetical protein AwWohl_14470 [Gammaproteobacteria bacterium]